MAGVFSETLAPLCNQIPEKSSMCSIHFPEWFRSLESFSQGLLFDVFPVNWQACQDAVISILIGISIFTKGRTKRQGADVCHAISAAYLEFFHSDVTLENVSPSGVTIQMHDGTDGHWPEPRSRASSTGPQGFTWIKNIKSNSINSVTRYTWILPRQDQCWGL